MSSDIINKINQHNKTNILKDKDFNLSNELSIARKYTVHDVGFIEDKANLEQVKSTFEDNNIYQPAKLNDLSLKEGTKVLQNIITNLEKSISNDKEAKLVSKKTYLVTKPVADSDNYLGTNNEVMAIALIMWILSELLPKLFAMLNKLNSSFTELTNSNFDLEIANAKLSLEYGLKANEELKLSALTSFITSVVESGIEAGGAGFSLVNSLMFNQNSIEKFNDQKNAFDGLNEKFSEIEKKQPELDQNLSTLNTCLTKEQTDSIKPKVKDYKDNLELKEGAKLELLNSLDPAKISGPHAQENLTKDLQKLSKNLPQANNIVSQYQSLHNKPSRIATTSQDLQDYVPKLKADDISIAHEDLGEAKNLAQKIAAGYGIQPDKLLTSLVHEIKAEGPNQGATLAVLPYKVKEHGYYEMTKKDFNNNGPKMDGFYKVSLEDGSIAYYQVTEYEKPNKLELLLSQSPENTNKFDSLKNGDKLTINEINNYFTGVREVSGLGLYVIGKDFVSLESKLTIKDPNIQKGIQSGAIYTPDELKTINNKLGAITVDNLLTNEQKIYFTSLSPSELTNIGLIKGGKFNIFDNNNRVYELDPNFESNGQLIIKCLVGDGLVDDLTITIPHNMRGKFAQEFKSAQSFTLNNLGSQLSNADLIKAYINNSNSDFAIRLKDKLPSIIEQGQKTLLEIKTQKDYITGVSAYFNKLKPAFDNSSAISVLNSTIDRKRMLFDSLIKLTQAGSKLGVANISYAAKLQEADARLLDTYAATIGRLVDIMGRQTNTFSDDFARFLKDLRDALIQQLMSSANLLVRYYGTR